MSGQANVNNVVTLTLAPGEEWSRVCRLDEIPRAGARVIRLPAGDVALFRTLDDKAFALRDKCPHKGGPLSQGIVYGNKVACPLHNWRIELDTGQAVAPDSGGAACFPVRVEDGDVYIALKK